MTTTTMQHHRHPDTDRLYAADESSWFCGGAFMLSPLQIAAFRIEGLVDWTTAGLYRRRPCDPRREVALIQKALRRLGVHTLIESSKTR
jgi:hypothetical protein